MGANSFCDKSGKPEEVSGSDWHFQEFRGRRDTPSEKDLFRFDCFLCRPNAVTLGGLDALVRIVRVCIKRPFPALALNGAPSIFSVLLRRRSLPVVFTLPSLQLLFS